MNPLKGKSALIGVFFAAGVLGVELVVIGIGAFRLVGASRNLDRSVLELKRLRTRDLYPSKENVTVAEDRLDDLEYKVSEYGASLKRDSFPAAAEDAAAFSAAAQNVIEHFQKRAMEAGVALPESSEVGFALYASQGRVPAADHVPRLSRQLYCVERVAGVLVDCGVLSIVTLSRDLFEEPEGAKAISRRHSVAVEKTKDKLLASGVDGSGLYYVERISVSFTADESAVWRVLDTFSTAPHCMAVVEFAHRTQSDILTFVPDARAGDVDLPYLSGGLLSGEEALTRDERLVAGDEIIRVDLVVDVYNFNPLGGF